MSEKKNLQNNLERHECDEICDKSMDTADVEFILIKGLSYDDRFPQEEEDTTRKSLVQQGLVCLNELTKSWIDKEKDKKVKHTHTHLAINDYQEPKRSYK